jgi:hypothetical protein
VSLRSTLSPRCAGYLHAALAGVVMRHHHHVAGYVEQQASPPQQSVVTSSWIVVCHNTSLGPCTSQVLAFARECATSPDMCTRCGGLTAVAVVCEGAADYLRRHMEDLLPLVLGGMQVGAGPGSLHTC